jgi:hypothetical protein
MMTHRITRRTVLKGLGTAVALPWLEAWGTIPAQAGEGATSPTRMAVVYVPNGVNMADWTPKATGEDYTLPRILEPLEPYRRDFLVLSGLSAHRADGPSGNHARAMAVFLTGRRPPDDGKVSLGISADQIAARAVGRCTRLPSLELGCEPATPVGHCDNPYSCAYTSNLSWASETSPLPPEVNPRDAFDRLFAGGDENEAAGARARRAAGRKSVLDFVQEDAAELRSELGADDRRKMDEYLTSMREVEARVGRAGAADPAVPPLARPPGVAADYPEHLRLMCDILVLAFQADVTRVSTLVFANEFSNRPYPCIDVRDGHHDLSHHDNDPDKLAKIREINRFHVGRFAYLLGRLKAVREGDGTLLDHCVIAYGCGNSDGNRHNHDDLPILLAGRGGGTIKPGRHVRYRDGTPLMNLWLSVLDRVGAPTDSLGDSTGRLICLDG